MNGHDPQIERLVSKVLDMMDEYKIEMTPAPPYEDRTAEGLKQDDR